MAKTYRVAVNDALIEAERELVHKDLQIKRLEEQYQALLDIAQRVRDADNQRLAAQGEPGWQAMKEMEDALYALHTFVTSNPTKDPHA